MTEPDDPTRPVIATGGPTPEGNTPGAVDTGARC